METQTTPLPFTELPWSARDFNGMPYRRVGPSGLQASAVGLGTWKLGYPETGDGSRVNEATAFKLFDRALELGVTFWDTANRYNWGSGNSERIIGKWLKQNPGQRRNVILGTKIFGGMDGVTPNHSRLSRLNILESTYACLDRLQTTNIDVLYFHTLSDDPAAPIEESLAAIEDLVRWDLVRYFAVGNATVQHVRDYVEHERQFSARCRVIAVQNHYDILNGELPDLPGVLDYCAQSGPAFISWSPLARGLLTDRYLDLSKVGKGDRLFDEGTLQNDARPGVHAKLLGLARLAHAWGYAVNQLALAYMLTLPGMGPVIPSASTVAQLESNAAVGKIVLAPEQQAQLRAVLSASNH